MSKNLDLRSASKNKMDEFYTRLTDIEKELKYYKDDFKDKVVFCNCDDPEESNFWKYFELNFTHLGLKKLISTHYDKTKPTYKLELIKDINEDGKINNLDIIKTPLKQNGDFRSPECIEILKEADIIVTNPPFSLFREYVSQLDEYNKKFIIMGNTNALTYKEVFKLFKDDKIRTGYTNFNTGMYYYAPDDIEQYHKIENGKKMVRVSTSCWYTNLNVRKHQDKLIMYKKYNKEEYPKYDNYDAINVNKYLDIPEDYFEAMGVPITFLDHYNPEQFEIIDGIGRYSVLHNEETKKQKKYLSMIDGKAKFFRVIIKRKKENEN